MIYSKLRIFFVVIGFAVLPVHPSAAAKRPSDLTCNVTEKNNAFIYLLSHPPSSSKCKTLWEDKNRTVIVMNRESVPAVQNVTDQSLTLDHCEPSLVYTVECHDETNMLMVRGEANCQINCSRLLDPEDNLTPTVNSTMICITESRCLPMTSFVFIVIGLIGIVILVVVALWCYKKWRARGSGTTGVFYTQPYEQVVVNIKTPVGDDVVQNHIV
ncbi:uncharacterized protein LOC120823612 [Gasterosteus aculeatus]